jgi:predicted membrane chloride channel (bestrophin family)
MRVVDLQLGLILSGLVAFLLSLFDQMTFMRWWDTRKHVQQVMDDVVDMAVLLCAYMPGNDAHSVAVREQVVRYMNLAHAFIYKAANGEDDDVDDLLDSKLMLTEEWNILDGTQNKHMTIYFWVRLSSVSVVCEFLREDFLFTCASVYVYVYACLRVGVFAYASVFI